MNAVRRMDVARFSLHSSNCEGGKGTEGDIHKRNKVAFLKKSTFPLAGR